MANTAAAVVDRVLPDVPVRQYVLSLPYELRRLAAFKADVLTALGRIFVETVFASYRARAKRDGVLGAQCGAIHGDADEPRRAGERSSVAAGQDFRRRRLGRLQPARGRAHRSWR
jgi:hypothetical protein